METRTTPGLDARVRQLERMLRQFQIGAVVVVVAAVAAAYLYFDASVSADEAAKILRVRGLIIEDAQGHERMLLGAPTPTVPGRKRQEETTGLIVLGENGADRMVMGYAPDPQSGGRISRRIGSGPGLAINDKDGNERAGLGMMDNDGRVSLGLDYPSGGEAVTLSVLPNDEASLHIKDPSSLVRAALVLHKDSAAKLYGLSWKDKSTLDMGLLRLAPYAVKQLTIKPDEKSFQNAIDSMKP
jgi:hypothetical protein